MRRSGRTIGDSRLATRGGVRCGSSPRPRRLGANPRATELALPDGNCLKWSGQYQKNTPRLGATGDRGGGHAVPDPLRALHGLPELAQGSHRHARGPLVHRRRRLADVRPRPQRVYRPWVGMSVRMVLAAETSAFRLLFLDLSYDAAKRKRRAAGGSNVPPDGPGSPYRSVLVGGPPSAGCGRATRRVQLASRRSSSGPSRHSTSGSVDPARVGRDDSLATVWEKRLALPTAEGEESG